MLCTCVSKIRDLSGMLPNFLLIGAARCGTTSLYKILQSHEDVYLPQSKRPEPHFFLKNDEYQKGLCYYECRYFPKSCDAIAIGEASTSYIFGPHVPARVAQSIPTVKSIALLRNPIDRAFSGYWHTVKSGLEKLSFEDALEQEEKRAETANSGLATEIQPFAYAARGDYHKQIMRWCKHFPRESLELIIFDDFLEKPNVVLLRLANFLGIDPIKFAVSVPPRLNQSQPSNAKISIKAREMLVRRFEVGIQGLSDFMQRDLMFWLR